MSAEQAPAIVTIARGRRRHLERQAEAVAAMDPAPAGYLLVSLDPEPPMLAGATVLHMPVGADEPLPLAAARNAGIEWAAERSELILCLDADCLPEPRMGGLLARAHAAAGDGWLLSGPVGRLGPRPEAGALPDREELVGSRRRTVAGPRPVPAANWLLAEPRAELFWSLSFAVSARDHRRIGGFDEAYVGYGAEDTDYAFRAREAGIGLLWVGGAWAHHQHHPVSSPPVEHLDEIVANARRFRARWGTWPMPGWLREFRDLGLVDWDAAGEELRASA